MKFKDFLLEYFSEDKEEKISKDYQKILPLECFEPVKDTFLFQSYLTYLNSKYKHHEPVCYKTWRDFEKECPEVIKTDQKLNGDEDLNDIYCLFILGMGWN